MPISILRERKVFDESGYVYEIGNVLYEMPNSGKVFSINGHTDKVYVEVPDMTGNRYAIKKMCDKTTHSLCFKRMLWPERLIQEKNGFISLNPKVHGKLVSLIDVIEERKTKKSLTPEEKLYYFSLGTQLAKIINIVHEFDYVVGVLSPEKFLVSDNRKLYSLLSYQFSFVEIDAFDNPYYISPEWLLTMNNKQIRYTKQSDAYLYATVLFQLLTGKYPFASNRNISEIDKEELWELMSDGKSLYYWEDEGIIDTIKEELCDLPQTIEALFKRTFDYCGNNTYDENRPLINEWLRLMQQFWDNLDGSGEYYDEL